MIHPHTELRYINDVIGYGVFAKDFIPEGTITYVKDSLELEVSPTDFLGHPPEVRDTIEKYSYIDERGYHIISWDFAKYVNHCCNCNTMSTGYGFEIAIRNIHPGEQITDEYGIFNLKQEMTVDCSTPGCRGVIRPNDFDELYLRWDERLKHSMPKLFQVEQPLMSFIDEATREELDLLAMDPGKYRSVYSLRFRDTE